MKIQHLHTIVLSTILISSCTRGSDNKNQHNDSLDHSNITLISTPAITGSGEPNLFTDESGNTFLSWVEESNGNSYLKFSKYSNSNWSGPQLIAQGENWFVNWADFPSFASLGDGKMAAHYLAKNGEGTFAYGVNIVLSADYGKTWSAPIIPHETETETEHGFVSIIPYNDDYFATWLDGRNTGGGHGHDEPQHAGAMSLRAAFINPEGIVEEEFLLDEKTCDCCQTSAVMTANGPIVAYRDRSDEEIRDISIVRLTENGWSIPKVAYSDNWLIPGCPVNGPALAAIDSAVALVWFTSPDQESKINLAFSDDSGQSFGSPVQVDMGSPIGRVDMEMIDDGSVYVSWMEAKDEIGQIMIAHYSSTGELIERFVLAENRSDRSSGFPRMATNGNDLIIAWRDMINEPKILAAKIEI